MMLLDNPNGNYQFLKGIGPYSSGVVALPGYEIIHVRTLQPLSLALAYERMVRYLEEEGRPIQALCGIQLRIPQPLSFQGFSDFNQEYQDKLNDLGLFLGEINPLARTNIAVRDLGLEGPSLHGFSFTLPSQSVRRTFIVAGAGDLKDQADLSPSAIVRPGDTSESALEEKASVVMQVMTERLEGLQGEWQDVTCVEVYTVYPVHPYLVNALLKPMGKAGWHGINWHFGEPPIEGLAFEMDMRGVQQERWI